MTTESALYDKVRQAWEPVPAPPVQDMKYMEWGWGAAAARAFTGVATWNVTLARGSYTYRSDVARSKHRLHVG